MEAIAMESFANVGETKEEISGDVILAFLIAGGIVVGDFILRHLPS
jgi:hypothetical protein